MTGPKTAFLIVAHTAPDDLARLVRALDAPWARAFVHIDAKAQRAPFDAALAAIPACVVLPDAERVAVNWGGFSIIETTLRLIRRAKVQMPDVQRFCLLSGADYPVSSMADLADALGSDVEYMKVNRRLQWGGSHKHDANITHPFYGDFAPANPRTGNPAVAKIADRLSQMIKRPPPAGVEFYHGSCWWALTRGAVDAMLQRLDDQPGLLDWFRRVKVPDEIVFQTLIKATPFAARLSQDVDAEPTRVWPGNLHGAHYINWKDANPSLPRTLVDGDLDDIRRSGALFMRKVEGERSAALLAQADGARREPLKARS